VGHEKAEREAEDNRTVLELRVHGVNNTPPAAILDLPGDQVGEVLGDNLAGFWRPKSPEGAPGNAATRGRVPDGITREAYSWGGLARRTPGGGLSAGSKVLGGLIAVGWTLLLPFGLANVAYWTRRLDESPGRRPGSGRGDGLVRMFGLCLTLFLVVTLCDIGMDLVARQCYGPRSGPGDVKLCSRLPGLFSGLANVTVTVRMVVFSALPILVLLGLWALTSLSRSRYERAFGADGRAGGALEHDTDGSGPILSDERMWDGDSRVSGLTRLHLAAGFAMITFCLTCPALFGPVAGCHDIDNIIDSKCLGKVADAGEGVWVYGAALALALVVMIFAAVHAVLLSVRRTRLAGTLLLVSLGVLALAVGALLYHRPSITPTDAPYGAYPDLIGVSAIPTVLLVLMLALVLWALFLRLSAVGWLWAALLAGSLVWLFLVDDSRRGLVALIVAGVVVVATANALLLSRLRGGKWQAWGGAGPSVFLGGALLIQGFLSAAVVLGVGDWLNGAKGASTLVPREHPAAGSVKLDTCGQLCPGQDPILTVPLPYLLLGAVGVGAVALVLAGAGLSLLLSGRGLDAPADLPDGVKRAVVSARRLARVAHRAEKLVGLVVGVGMVLALGAAVTTVAGWVRWNAAKSIAPSNHWERTLDVTTAAVAAVAVAALAALVKGAGSGQRRPLGLVWDLVSFLPRAAHPFAPPCYAERAVPELTERVYWWLKQDGLILDGQRRGGDKVVISAHSLGGVLTVAAMMRDSLGPYEKAGRIRLLTYGAQLRAYFSRIFPELLGPQVLGTASSRAATFWSADPWRTETYEKDRPDYYQRDGSVTGRLSLTDRRVVLWRGLWRRTDYIGFPVSSFLANPIDRRADEVDQTGYLLEVLTHSNYPRTPQYRRALLALALFPEGSTGPPDQSA
jgi:hypothetical protein